MVSDREPVSLVLSIRSTISNQFSFRLAKLLDLLLNLMIAAMSSWFVSSQFGQVDASN